MLLWCEASVDPIVHDFKKELDYSMLASHEPAWLEFYYRLWPNLVRVVRNDKGEVWQRWGLDRLLFLPAGHQLWIDEKKRKKDYGDVLIEEWNVGRYGSGGVYHGEKMGWSLDKTKRCHFVAYAVPVAAKCYLLPFELLRITCEENLGRWKSAGNYPQDSRNNGYVTRNCPVAWPQLHADMLRVLVAHRLTLPTPDVTDNGKQMLFPWGQRNAK
jgi:hypothetical protein